MPRQVQIGHPYSGRSYVLDGSTIQQILNAFVHRIVGGKGIRCSWFGQQLVIEATGSERVGRGFDEVTAETLEELEAMDLAEGQFCRTTGDEKRMYRKLGDDLICLSHTEMS